MAGERATWPKIPIIDTTTRIGRTLDEILHAFEVDQVHWLRTAPQTDAALDARVERGARRAAPATPKRSKRTAAAIERKAARAA